jgi:hypothetical protein
VHLRHHVTADGFYRGKKVIRPRPRPSKKIDPGCGRVASASGYRMPSAPPGGGARNRKHDEQADLLEDRRHR